MSKETRTMFKKRFRRLSSEEKKKELDEMRLVLMKEYTSVRKSGGASDVNLRELRRRIAMAKTIMNEPGYHFHPRQGVN